MVKLRRQRRRKKFNHNVNRKRLRNKLSNIGNIECKEVKLEWDSKKSINTNLKEMGLSSDPNETIKIPKSKSVVEEKVLQTNIGWNENTVGEPLALSKIHVAKTLEEDAKAPREKKIRLPNSQVEWVTYLIEKYADDYKAMARDKKNYNQETWKQIRQKIKRFRSIPEQYNIFLEKTKSVDDKKYDVLKN